jgi:gamma-glutamylcysteine synthetase
LRDAKHLLAARLARIGQAAGVATLAGNRFGLEKEGLRVSPEGKQTLDKSETRAR